MAVLPSSKVGHALRVVSEAWALMSRLDVKRVESESGAVVERLVKNLTKEETGTLIQWSVAYRSGQVRYADFYAKLQTLCRGNGIDLPRYPVLADYIRYVLLADGIDLAKLTDDL